MESSNEYYHQREFVFIKSKSEQMTIHKVFCEDIIACEAVLNYTKFHLSNGCLTSYIGLSEVAGLFKHDSRFLRVHKSFIVAVKHIEQIRREHITMKSGLYFVVGEMYMEGFKKLVSEHLIKSSKVK